MYIDIYLLGLNSHELNLMQINKNDSFFLHSGCDACPGGKGGGELSHVQLPLMV